MRRSSRCDPPEASAVAPPAQATPWWQFAQAALLARLLAKRDDGPAEDLEVADDAAAMALQAFAEEVSAGEGTFGQLAAACDLDDVDVAVLAVLVACEFDADCSALASALGGTANGHTTFALVQEVLGVQGLDALAPGAPLDRAGLVEVADAGRLLDAAVAVPRPVSWRVLDAPPNAGELQDARLLRAPLEVGMTLGAATRVLVSGADRVRRYQAALRHAAALVAWVAPPPS
ncbi:MAG: hypothetical protein QOC66_2215, partial [Pseudonocardiales bacterium]|nr:hypothetical protein [Pseudonocardiales bacterium]